jgi:hypothetical protein
MSQLQRIAIMKMIRNIIVACFLLPCTLAGGASLSGAFSGEWDWNDAPESRTFSLKIEQQGNRIKGQYCAVSQNGNKIDCDDEDNQNINGATDVAGTSAVVEFSSFFGATKGRAMLKISNGRLSWRILKNPTGGEFYAPMAAVLDRSR